MQSILGNKSPNHPQCSTMIGIKQKYQDLFFQTEQTVNRKKSGFRAAQRKWAPNLILTVRNIKKIPMHQTCQS